MSLSLHWSSNRYNEHSAVFMGMHFCISLEDFLGAYFVTVVYLANGSF